MSGVRSMTGYGMGQAPVDGGAIRVELRTVNHRHLDVRVRLPEGLDALGMPIDRRVREVIGRGRVEATVHVEHAGGDTPLDTARLRAVHKQLQALRDELDPQGPLPVWPLALLPDAAGAVRRAPKDLEKPLAAALDQALEALRASQVREGEALAADLRKRLAECASEVEAIGKRVPGLVDERKQRLEQRLEQLLADGGVEVDPARLAMEVALIADRADVAEELARLAIHLQRIGEWLDGTEEPGRKISFLLQEVGREANTIGSKIQDPETSHRVVALKTAIERMRQQVANVA